MGDFVFDNFATDGSIAAFSIEVDGSLARVPGAPFGHD